MEVKTIFEFVRFAINDDITKFSFSEDLDWVQLYEFAKKQKLAGVLFAGVEKLPKGQQPPIQILMKWYGLVDRIRVLNQEINEKVVRVCKQFSDDGFLNCVLKGQGNALMYPRPELRNPGDIDLWPLAGRKEIIDYVRKDFPDTKIIFHHLDYPISDRIETEVHFFPISLNNPVYNHRFQSWVKEIGQEQCENWVALPEGQFCRPTETFNVVYQLAHIYRHFFHEGIGLRQMMDYYFLLKNEDVASRKDELCRLLRRFGLLDFAKAAMYVMKEVFGLADKYLLLTPDEKVGKMLLDEILITGNFGQKDSRYGNLKQTSRIKRITSVLKKNLQFWRYFLGEIVFSLLFRVIQQPLWRIWAKYKYEH